VANPDVYMEGLGETIRAHRTYLGLSKGGMARQLGMSNRSYERIEDGTADCPPGLLDTIDKVTERFDREVQSLVRQAERVGPVEIPVSNDIRQEWRRNVVARAAVLEPNVIVTLTGTPIAVAPA
jgi:transcriptional regulator with XRE-family HTH domain